MTLACEMVVDRGRSNLFTCITLFGTVYAFHKPLSGSLSINCPKPGYIV